MPVEIWTLMAGMPEDMELSGFAAEMHAKWGTTTAEDTLQVRRAEDFRAAKLLGAKAVHLDFPDAIYRQGPDRQALYGEPVGTTIHPQDMLLPSQMARELATRLVDNDTIICPLALGAHVDHVIVRQAAEALGRPLRYVADVPYSMYHPGELAPATAGMESRLYRISESGFGVWLEAIQSYASQLSTLYESWDLLREAVRQYWLAEGGIRLWSVGGLREAPGLDSASKS